MKSFKIHSLGCGSAKPTARHLPSCTVVEHNQNLYMVDCGEAAQLSFQKAGLKFHRLSNIFLTHLHGDHILGLPGLLSTMAMSGVGGKITIHTFEEGARYLQTTLDFFGGDLSFDIDFDIITPEEKIIFESPSLTVRTIPLRHRVKTVGFVFEEKPKPLHLRGDMLQYHEVPNYLRPRIKAGEDFTTPDGKVVPNAQLTSPADPALSYAHISDTAYMPSLAQKIGPVTLLYHETTYLDRNLAEAKARFHSTARQAARTAADAGARALLTGHYSSRYRDEADMLEEASEVFPNVIIGREGLVTDLYSL